MEWEDRNKYNSFNSVKGLAYYEHYQKIMAWMDGDGELPPPIEASLDPTMRCNNDCYYCNSQRYLREDPLHIPPLSWKEQYALITRLAEWGVKGLCFGGGGESTLNTEVSAMLKLANDKGLQTSIITNGTMLYDKQLRDSLMGCRFVGVSLDAPDAETYQQIRGVDLFARVEKGVKLLVADKIAKQSKVDIAIKVLVLPENYDKLHDICVMAKECGVQDFHIRPVDLERKDFKQGQRLNLDMDRVRREFERCQEEATDNFHVYTVTHKYDTEFHVKHDFEKCLASPLVIQCCTDRNAYVCVDHRLEERFKLGSWEDMSWWGSDSHRELLKTIEPHKECSRCTWGGYNRQITEVVENDSMCLAFP